MIDDESISDEEIIQVIYQKYIGESLTFEQAEKMVEVAFKQNLSWEEIIEEVKYTASKAKTNPSGHLYRSLSAGGYYKTKLEKEAKKAKEEQQKPKRRLVRKSEKIPEMLRLQMEGQQPPEPVNSEERNERITNIHKKLKLMNEKFAKVGK